MVLELESAEDDREMKSTIGFFPRAKRRRGQETRLCKHKQRERTDSKSASFGKDGNNTKKWP